MDDERTDETTTVRTQGGVAPQRPDVARVRRFALVLAALDRTLQAAFRPGRGMPHDLSQAQYAVLALVAAEGVRSQAVMAQHLGVTEPSVVRLVDVLERKGLVARHRDQPDRRRVRVTLTARGRQVHHAATEQYEAHVATLLERLPPPLQDRLLQALTLLLTGAPDTDAAPA